MDREYWLEWAAGEVEVGNDDVIDAGGVDADFEDYYFDILTRDQFNQILDLI
jgi:hypothetical protein